ncbi:hypothetical protein ABH924_004149, partial [Arthrobacter sp. GAS37]
NGSHQAGAAGPPPAIMAGPDGQDLHSLHIV